MMRKKIEAYNWEASSTMSIYILVKWSLFQIKDRGETKNIANKHLFRLTAASCKPLSVKEYEQFEEELHLFYCDFYYRCGRVALRDL